MFTKTRNSQKSMVVEDGGGSSGDSYYGDDNDEYVMSSDENIEESEDEIEGKKMSEKPRIKKVASIMSDILGTNEEEEGPFILSKTERKKDKRSSIDPEKEKELKEKRAEKLMKKKLRLTLGREIPSIEQNYEKERKLRIIGTQGVVQLFTTIDKHRKVMKGKLMGARTEHEKERVLAETKDSFANLLEDEREKLTEEDFVKRKKLKEETSTKMEIKDEIELPAKLKTSSKSNWNVFAKDYYKEPVLSGWDKEDSDDG